MPEPAARPDLLGLPRPALGGLLDRLGVGAVHASRVFRGIHARDLALEAIDGLGERHAARIREATWQAEVLVEEVQRGDDGSAKLLFRLGDGARVEGVLLPNGERLTFCASSQVGCAMGCAFCATGRLGLTRGLRPGEIVRQVLLARRHAEAAGRRLSRLVFMGMGEPLHHYEATRDAIRVLTDEAGPAFGLRAVTVSTVGVVPRISELGRDFGGRVQLALSLNAGTQPTRARLVPMAARHDLGELRAACAAYPLPPNHFLMIEYVLLGGLTDTEVELSGLAAFAGGLRAMVNLIPFNPVDGSGFSAPPRAAVERARRYLADRDIPARVRRPLGRRIDGACGQLALRRRRANKS